MEWVGCIHCEKFQIEFMAQIYALIAPVHPILHRVSCSNETLPNAPKHYETHQNMSLWSNGVGRVRSLWKIPKRLHGTNLCINCTYSSHFAPRRTKTIVKGPMEWVGCIRCQKFQNDFMAQTCALIALVQPIFTEFRVVMKYCHMHPNTTRRTKIWV